RLPGSGRVQARRPHFTRNRLPSSTFLSRKGVTSKDTSPRRTRRSRRKKFRATHKATNPKSEYRNPKQAQNKEISNAMKTSDTARFEFFPFDDSNLFRISDFELRICF